MEVKGVDRADLIRIVDQVSDELYGGNIVVRDSRNRHNSKGLRSSFTIKAVASRDPGARRSWTGRRMPVACWHAHWHVLDRLFREYPDAEVTTMWYRSTAATFHGLAAETVRRNVGSLMSPVGPLDLCDCDDDVWRNPVPIVSSANHPDRAHLESLARVDYVLVVRGVPAEPKTPETVEDRITREIARAEATMREPINGYSWSAQSPHPYEPGFGFRSPV